MTLDDLQTLLPEGWRVHYVNGSGLAVALSRRTSCGLSFLVRPEDRQITEASAGIIYTPLTGRADALTRLIALCKASPYASWLDLRHFEQLLAAGETP